MKAKLLFVVIITASITAILLNNKEDMELWIFGIYKFSKLAVLGTMLALGFILGLLVRSGSSKSSKEVIKHEPDDNLDEETEPYLKKASTLSDEDRDYIN